MLKTEGYENSQLFMPLTPKNGVKASKLYSYKPIDGTGDFVWSRALAAYRLNQEGVLELMGNNVPRVDYTNTCPELLIEKESENLLTHSETFDNVAWVKTGSTIDDNAILAPNNNLTADKLIEDVGLGQKYILQQYITSSTNTFTFSAFIKADGRNFVRFGMTDGISDAYVDINLTNGNTANLTALGSWTNPSVIVRLVNGFYRISFTCTKGAGTSIFPIIYLCNTIGNTSYTGDGTSGVYLWGAQLEESNYATSYIPTTTTAQTRTKDVCYNTANTFGDAAWSIVMRVRLNNIGSSTSEPLIALNDGSTDNYFCIYTDANPKLYFDWYNNPDQETLNTTDLSNGIYNVGVSYDDSTGDYIIVLDGSLEFAGNVGVSLAGAFTGSFNRLDLGTIAGTGNLDGDGIIGVQYYNSALSQSDLENLTS